MKKTLTALAVAVSLALAGCSSWDESTSSVNHDIADSLTQTSSDPRAMTGASIVDNLSEVEPITDDPQPALPVELVDADGFDATVTDTSRILALDLYGTYTKTLRGLGLADNIIGRTVSSDEASLADLPVVTENGHSLNVEAILNLQPTLVLVDHSVGPSDAIEQIRNAGVTTVVLSPTRSLDTVAEDIQLVADTVGLPEEGEKLAQRSVDEIEEARAAIDKVKPETPLRMAFLYARGTGGVFFILGGEDGSDDLIGALGGEDVATEHGISSVSPASAEALAEINPEVFIMMTGGLESTGSVEGLLDRPGVIQTVAGQNQRVLALPDGSSLAFGPQTGELLLRAATALYGSGE